MVDLALKILLHDKLRFTITVAGVAFAVALVLSQIGLFFGLLSNATPTIRNASADLWVTSHNTPNVDFAHQFPETYVNRVRSVPGVAKADNLIVTFMNITLPSGAEEGGVFYALEDFGAWNLPWRVKEGDIKDLRRGEFIFLDESAKRRLGDFAMGDFREVQHNRLRIAGQSQDAKSFTTTPVSFIDFRRAQEMNPDLLKGNTSYILVKLAPGADASAVKAEIQRRLPFNDVYTSNEWASKSEAYWIKNTGIGLNAFLAVFLGVLVGVVVVAQTLYTSTMEHIKEFGTVKAIGGSNADIYRILARQATIAAALGFVLGLGLAFAQKPAIEAMALKLIMPTSTILVVAVGTLLLCLASAMVSFRKVANVDPGLVFRS
ncbi:MAG: ABC transporter permease [Acidobacteriota bacterium]|nr:ABC transporter permease [Acidobacteriota bacterium]